ncbi:hypothetical protein EI94DRAFT_1761354 [Lactarius quietus]|nr:hypothetical protein EI94DRAFT_1761354 [Lactarius quietus]
MQLVTNKCGCRATKTGKNGSEEVFATKSVTCTKNGKCHKCHEIGHLKANCQAKRINEKDRCPPRQNGDDADHHNPNAHSQNGDGLNNHCSCNSNRNNHANVHNTWPKTPDIENGAATKGLEADEPVIPQVVQITITAPLIHQPEKLPDHSTPCCHIHQAYFPLSHCHEDSHAYERKQAP